jgi:hypothetical protein
MLLKKEKNKVLFSFIVVLAWYIVAFTKYLQCIKYIRLVFTPFTVILYPHFPLFLEDTFLYLHTGVQMFVPVLLLTPFLCHLSPSQAMPPTPTGQDLFCSPVFCFCRRKKEKIK